MPVCESIVQRTGEVCQKKATSHLNGKSFCGIHARVQTIQNQKISDKTIRTMEEWETLLHEQIWQEEQAYIAWGVALLAMDVHRGKNLDAHPEIATPWLQEMNAKETVERVCNRTKTILRRSRGVSKIALVAILEHERGQIIGLHQGLDLQHRMRANEAIQEEERRIQERVRQLHAQTVTFRRDPVGDIALYEFAKDGQNVHRSSIQSATVVSLERIMNWPTDGNSEKTLEEVGFAFREFPKSKKVLMDLKSDIYVRNLEAFGFSYKDVLNHLWSRISKHPSKEELVVRFFQELLDGYQMCSNGKMCRLVNVLQGYDEGIMLSVSRDAFQGKFATLQALPLAERRVAGYTVLSEYSIPMEEWPLWMDPLLEI